jgi:hypothetical protein
MLDLPVDGDDNFFSKCSSALCSKMRVLSNVNGGVRRSSFF